MSPFALWENATEQTDWKWGRAGGQARKDVSSRTILSLPPNDAPVILACAQAGAAKTGRISFRGPEDEGWRDYISERNRYAATDKWGSPMT